MKDNHFILIVQDYAPTLLQPWHSFYWKLAEQLRAIGGNIPDPLTTLCMLGKEDPNNLKEWCKLAWGRKLPALPLNRYATVDTRVVMGAHGIAKVHICRSWADCEKTLDHLFFVVGAWDRAWEIKARL